MSDKKLHLVGNAHIDPVWRWRFFEGFSEIKATFRSALDRIREYDDFVFTSACASYYKWVEENCPPMFEEIKEAVGNGKWIIVGGMWLQPDCNMPSSESFARHMLYSQRYFKEKFGITAKTGYNVDSFGHSAGLPRLLRSGGMENYVFMRPSAGAEKKYPFTDRAFRWTCGDSEVLTYRLPAGYAQDYTNEDQIANHVRSGKDFDYPQMIFFGVGNHGGGPTIRNIETIHAYRQNNGDNVCISDPDSYFSELREKHFDKIPEYTGELQNHASGCYSANSMIKKLNRTCENRLGIAERMEVLSSFVAAHPVAPEKNAEAWQKVLFNQFHDILCGCSIKAAYDDAAAFGGAAIAHALDSANAAAQRISWSIDTGKGVTVLSKGTRGIWEQDDLGTPIVVFNPLSHPVRTPVSVYLNTCAGVTDENDVPVPYQMTRADYTNRVTDIYRTSFIAEVPPCGWRTYWVFRNLSHDCPTNGFMKAGRYSLRNDRVKAEFDPYTGELSSVVANGRELLGELGCRTLVLDDSPYDTWSHAQFTFENKIGVFGQPTFDIIDRGDIKVSVKVTQTWQASKLERTYTLIAGDANLYVDTRLVLGDERVMVKFAFDAGLPKGEFIREVPGDVMIERPSELAPDVAGRELPMLRFMAIRDGERGLAVINDAKYSASCRGGEIRMVAARSCYFGDHFGQRDGLLRAQDIGEQDFRYAIRACGEDIAPVVRAAEELNTEFPVIAETYHKGELPQRASFIKTDAENVTLTALKPAEDGQGYIVRFTEISGKPTRFEAKLMNVKINAEIAPFDILSFRIDGETVASCNFIEEV